MTGAELAAKRKAAGLTQEELAEKVGFTGKHRALQISALEIGDRVITARHEATFNLLFASLDGAK